MAEEMAAQEVEADAPMINVTQPEEPSAEAPIAVHEQPQEEAQASQEDDTPLERPDYYPEKFWDEDGPDVEKLAKSYAELEKSLSLANIKHRMSMMFLACRIKVWMLMIRLSPYIRNGLKKMGLARMLSKIWPRVY